MVGTSRSTSFVGLRKLFSGKLEARMGEEIRKSGIDIIGDVPWGTHFCQFYQTKEDLGDILVPYFKAGLENNEFCMWVTSESLSRKEAEEVMRKAVPNFDQYLARGQIKIIPYNEWYIKDGAFNLQRVLNAWIDKLNQALASGYDGIRVTGDTAWLRKREWEDFTDYEEEVNNAIGKYRLIAICTYLLDKCGASEVIDVAHNHQLVLIRRAGNWVTMESNESKQIQDKLSQTSVQLQALHRVTAAIHSTLDLDEVFKQVADNSTRFLGYTTALILTLNDEKKCFEVKAISTKKWFLPQIGKLLGLPLKNFSVPADYEFKGGLRSVIEGRTVVAKSLAEVMYPLISKKACSALEKIAGTRNCIVVPLEVKGKVSGALFITSPREEVSEDELVIVQNFARVASQAIGNAQLHMQTKQAKDALRQSEENLKSYLEMAPDGVYLCDLKGTFLYGNKKAEELIGYKKEALIGQSFLKLNLLPGKYLAKAGKLLALNAMGRATGPDEFELMRRDGNLIWVEISTTPIKQAEGKVVIGFVRDITDRKWMEEALQNSVASLRQVITKNADSMLIVDRSGIVRFVNPATESLFACKAKDLLGKQFGFPIVAGETMEIEIMQNGGNTAIAEMRVVETEWEGEAVYLASLRDITERKKAEESLIVTNRLASVGEMASGIAHELNNPLTSVIGLSQLIMDGDVPDDIKEDVGTIYSEAQRAAGVVKNLLTFARKHAPVRQLTQINRTIEDVLKLRAYEHRINNIQVNTHFDPELPETMVDHFQLQQVFLNVILNAESAMLEAHNKGTLTITTEKVNNTIKVSLGDDGPGIAKENLSRIFNPFFTTKEVGKGTGLGLSICYGIVTAHGGRIYARSELGRGATFVVEFPLVPIN